MCLIWGVLKSAQKYACLTNFLIVGVFLFCNGCPYILHLLMKKTLVLGATPNPERYAYLAVGRLLQYKHEVVPVGVRKEEVHGLEILEGKPEVEGVDTVTLYIGPARQPEYYDYIFSLHPKRIIFNPGTENPELMQLARERGIEVVEGCTLVMLSIGAY